MKVIVALFVLISVVEFGDAKRIANRGPPIAGRSSGPAMCDSFPICPPSCVTDVTGPCPTCDCSGFCDLNCAGDSCKVVRNGNACACACTSGDDGDDGNSDACAITCPDGCTAIANNGQCSCLCNGGNSGPATCDSFPICPPSCVTDVSGPCPSCDCSGFCDLDCAGDSCKVVRNGNACACACTSGDDDDAGTSDACAITCPDGCTAIANNGQCSCLCNGNDGDDVCVIDCPPQCQVTRDCNGNCQCVCF
ncbi:spider silk-constituting element SpiCE-NMa2A [Trichonephila clavata]|uniref:Spider silk-constituting element SpiCE-NMa2A n=1 Tax=Trichonephila clavata TaxID=2740835 RepID=A0A8X6GVD7_TRICU|nr:spider silk-constituting element SpiCE-NMa2A [Trichonephila clavata]